MKRLFEIDLHDYAIGYNVFRRPSARDIIFDDCGRIALVYIKHNDLTPSAKYFKPGTKGTELVSDLNVVSDNIFIKSKGNALTSEDFKSFVDKNEITEFYVTGADATECVKSTCYNMEKSGYTVHVISDGITSYNKAKISEMIENYKKKGCDVIKLNQLKEI